MKHTNCTLFDLFMLKCVLCTGCEHRFTCLQSKGAQTCVYKVHVKLVINVLLLGDTSLLLS